MKQDKPKLRKYLESEIMREGHMSLDMAHAIAKEWGQKEASVERILRKSMSSEIITLYNQKGHITGYVPKELPQPASKPIPELELTPKLL